MTKVVKIAALSLLILIWSGGFANAEDTKTECITSEDDSFICEGDKSWTTGYILGEAELKELLDKESLLEAAINERDKYRDLSDDYQALGEEYEEHNQTLWKLLDSSQMIADEYQKQRDKMEDELEIIEVKYEDAMTRIQNLQDDLSESWDPWEVGLLAGGVGVGAILIGAGIAALAM